MDARMTGNKATRRLILVCFLSCVFLSLMYASRDQLSTLGYSDLLQDSSIDLPENVLEDNSDYVETAIEAPPELPGMRSISLKACKERRRLYRDLLKKRNFQRTLKFDKSGKLSGMPYTMGETQELASNICHSSRERYALVKHEIDSSVNLCNALEQPSNRTTVVLRLEHDNLFTEDAVKNLRSLILEVGWNLGYDINVLQNVGEEYDEDRVPTEFRRLLTNFQNDEVFDGYPVELEAKDSINRIGLNYKDDFARYSTTFYQFPEIWFFSKQKTIDFAYFIESHVRSSAPWDTLFASLADTLPERIDVVTFDPIQATRPSVLWNSRLAGQPETYYRTSLIVHGISKRAVQAMNTTLQDGINAPFEGFVPAVAFRHDLQVGMFAHPIMQSIKSQHKETYTVPQGLEWPIYNSQGSTKLHNVEDTSDEHAAVREVVLWQFGGTFAAEAPKWVQDAPLTKWIDNMYQEWVHEDARCLPGLIIYPVSGR